MRLLSSPDDLGLIKSVVGPATNVEDFITHNVDTLPEELEVLHDYLVSLSSACSMKENSRFSGLYLAYRTDNSVNIPYDRKLPDDCLQRTERARSIHHVRPLETKTALHKRDDLVKVAIAFVKRQQSGEFLGMNLRRQRSTSSAQVYRVLPIFDSDALNEAKPGGKEVDSQPDSDHRFGPA